MNSLSAEEIRTKIHELGPWFHNLNLEGISTAPEHYLGDYPAVKWRKFANAIREDLSGSTVLDIGCNAGFYALEMSSASTRRKNIWRRDGSRRR